MVAVLDAQRTFKGHGYRETWIDVARGMGIVLVVFGHVWRGIFNAGLLGDEVVFVIVDRTIYLFHMPLFFVLSGIFFAEGVLKRGVRSAFVNRIFVVAYPYILWTYLNVSLKYLAGNEVNTPVDIDQVLGSYYPPIMQFWFLFHLFFIQTILSFLFFNRTHYFLVCTSAAVVALVIYQSGLAETLLPTTFLLILPNFIYFVVGMALGAGRLRLDNVTGRTLWMAAIGFGVAQIAFNSLPVSVGTTLEPAFALICVLATLAFARSLADRWKGFLIYWFSSLGTASMAIFVAHVIFTAGTRVGLMWAGENEVISHCIAGTVVGLLGPYILFILSRNAKIQWQVGFGGAPNFGKAERAQNSS